MKSVQPQSTRSGFPFQIIAVLPALCLAAALIASSGTAHATLINDIGAVGVAGVSGYYTSPGNAGYTAGAEGYTPHVSGSWSGFLDPWWIGMYFGSDTRFTLTADPGYKVTLMDFQTFIYGGNPRPGYTVLDHNGNVMATIAQGVADWATMSSFGWPTLTDTQLTIVFATDETDNAGIGNITFSEQAPPPANILTFGLPGNPAAIDSTNKTITLYVPNGTAVTNLAPTYTLSTGTCDHDSGATTYDFTYPVTYTVTDEVAAVTNHYVVTVYEASIETTVVWSVGDGTWDLTTVNWVGQFYGQPQVFADGDAVIFHRTTGGTITITDGMLPASTTVSGSGTYTFTGDPIGGGTLTNDGPGTLDLRTAPTNFSSVVVNGGTLYLDPVQDYVYFFPLEFNMNSVTVNSGATLMSERTTIHGGLLTMNGGRYWEDNGFGGSWIGPVYLAADSFFGQNGWCCNQTIDGEISGPGGFTFSTQYGAVLTLTVSNSYAGPTIVTGGTVQCNDPHALGSGGPLRISAGGAKVNLNYTGTHVVSALTLDGVSKDAGVYGSSSSPAPVWNQDDVHFAGTGTVTVPGTPPLLATFTAVPTSGAAPLEVVFTDNSSSGYGPITNWSWNFGNGITTNYTSAVATLTNTYVLWGTYPVTLIVADDSGRSATNYPTSIVVTQPTNLVVSSAGQYQTVTVNVDPFHTVTFDAGIDNPAFGGLTGSGSLALTDAVGGCVTLVVGGNGPDSAFGGALTGCGGLTKVGANQFSLASPNNTYLGDTVVSNGTLNLPQYAVTPGLWEGLVTEGGGWDTTGPIPQTTVRLSDRMADSYDGWTDSTTWGYTGYFNNPASTDVVFKFGKAFDDNGLIKIDGTVVINDTDWSAFVTANHTLSPGWHTLELRVGQGGGGVGPMGNMKDNGVSVGLGWSTDGGTTWHGFSDPGNGTVLGVELSGNDILPTGTTLRVVSPGIVFFGGTNTVNCLFIDGTPQATGTWGSVTSDADHTDSHFTGNGILIVSSMPSAAPAASFTVATTYTKAVFTNTSDYGYGHTFASNLWEFGDSATATNVNPIHIYAGAGSRDVILTITNEIGQSSSATQTVILTAIPEPGFAPGSSGFHMDPSTHQAKITFTSAVGVTYLMEYKDDLLSPAAWTPCSVTTLGTGADITITGTDSTTGVPQRFYRIEAYMAP